MEAKETVMDLNKLTEEEQKHLPDIISFSNIAKAQAEISFKAGQKVVVEWIVKVKGESYYVPFKGIKAKSSIILDKELWQAQKKEWGIE